MTDILIWGGTGQAKVTRPIVERAGHRVVLVFDSDSKVSPPFPDLPLMSDFDALERWLEERRAQATGVVVAIGRSGPTRCRIADWLGVRTLSPLTAVHERAWIREAADLGAGCQIMALPAVGLQARLGRQCIVNTSASVDHETRLGDGVHIMPGANLAGNTEVGDHPIVGTNATGRPRAPAGKGASV